MSRSLFFNDDAITENEGEVYFDQSSVCEYFVVILRKPYDVGFNVCEPSFL